MFTWNSAATVEENLKYDMYKYLNPGYANVRCLDMDECNIYNATFLEDGKYYESVRINNISEKEAIMKFAKKEKVFGDKENKVLEEIINKNIVETKNNFFDYYND